MKNPLGDRLLGRPEGAPPSRLRQLLRYGGPAAQARALREIGARADAVQARPLLLPLLSPPHPPAVRRCAAWALGQAGQAADAEGLLARAAQERCDEVRLALAVAAVRCGAPAGEGWAALARACRRRLATWYGPRRPADATGYGEAEAARRFRLALEGRSAAGGAGGEAEVVPAEVIRLRAREVLARDPEDRASLVALAAQQHPADLDLLQARQAGRRTRHAATAALGMHGDPRAAGLLRETLRAVVDPGQGFANRRLAAEALGRLGLPEWAGVLAGALEAEALEFEGRPGAGLGVQYPVRSVLLWALGEAGEAGQARRLAGYLSNTHGSALGGFYLPAMDALWKLGPEPAVLDALRRLLPCDEELVVANALGVLAALGQGQDTERFRADGRARVAAAAQGAEEEVAVPDQRLS